MAGIYGEHVANHWVILYELEPEVSPNGSKADVEEVYFHRYVHHDDQEEAVVNIDGNQLTTTFEAAIPYETEFQAALSLLHDSNDLVIDTPQYFDDEVRVTGTLAPSDESDVLDDLLPDAAEVEHHAPSVDDITSCD